MSSKFEERGYNVCTVFQTGEREGGGGEGLSPPSPQLIKGSGHMTVQYMVL